MDIDPKRINSLDYIRFGNFKVLCWWGEKYNRTISWSVDGRQPKDEFLLQISFSTGAYIFGDDYPTELFQKFWLELKTFKPDYIDEANNSLYWNIENAKEIFNSFDDILKKYNEINKNEYKQRKIDNMQKELDKLKNQ